MPHDNANPEHPLEIIRRFVRQHLPQVYVRPDELMRMIAPGVPATGRVAECFAEFACITRLDVSALATRCMFSSERDKDVPAFAVLAEVWVPPVDLPHPIMLLLTSDMEVVFAIPTDAEERDGALQIYGAEPGAILLTVEQYKGQQGRKLYRGTSVRRAWLEYRGGDDTWSRMQLRTPPPASIVLFVAAPGNDVATKGE